MRHVGAGEGGEDPRLAPHRLVAVRPLVRRRPAQHELAVAPTEPHEHVLRATGDQLDVGDRAVAEVAVVHPLEDPVEVDDRGIEEVGHEAIIPGTV